MVKGLRTTQARTFVIPSDSSFGVDMSMADSVATPVNDDWREALATNIYIRRTGTIVSSGVIAPEWYYPIYNEFFSTILEPCTSLTQSVRFREEDANFRAFARRRGILPLHSDPRVADIAGTVLYSAPRRDLPRLTALFPMSNFISVYACMAFTQSKAELTAPPADLFSVMGLSANRGSIIKDILTMQITSETNADFQNIFIALLNPTQVSLSFDFSSEELNPKTRVLAILVMKLLFVCSNSFSNLTLEQAQVIDDYLMANVHAYEITVMPGTRTGMRHRNRDIPITANLQSSLNPETGWLNYLTAASESYREPLYHGVSHFPIYGNQIEIVPPEAVIQPEHLNAASPPILEVILRTIASISSFDRDGVPSLLAAYRERYLVYLIRLNSFIYRYYEHGLRLPYDQVLRLRTEHDSPLGPPVRLTVSLRSVLLYFLHLPSKFESACNSILELECEADFSLQYSLILEGMRQARIVVDTLGYRDIVSQRDSLKAVTSSLTGGLTKIIFAMAELRYAVFTSNYENIIDHVHDTPWSVGMRSLFAAFFYQPEWFGATNRVSYALRNYEFPTRDRLQRLEAGVILTNATVGDVVEVPAAEWRRHLSQGILLYTLYSARNSPRSLHLSWYVPYSLIVSRSLPKLPEPFTVQPGMLHSSDSKITFGSFLEYHLIGADVEPSMDQWLVNDMVHKFVITHKRAFVTQVDSAVLNHMVRRVNSISHADVEIVVPSKFLESVFQKLNRHQ